MYTRIFFGALALTLVLSHGDSRGQGPATEARAKLALAVRGEVAQPLKLDPGELARMARRSIKVKDHDGRESVYDGVVVADILKKAGVKQGKDLRGEFLAAYLLVEAADGYRVVFSLPELDEAYTDRIVLLADRKDGEPLNDHEGPFRIVVPDEKTTRAVDPASDRSDDSPERERSNFSCPTIAMRADFPAVLGYCTGASVGTSQG